MKSALKNESKDTGCKNRDWNQGRSDFKPLCNIELLCEKHPFFGGGGGTMV